MTRRLVALAAAPLLLVGCSGGSQSPHSSSTDADVAASAPVPGVTLPPDALVDLVLHPDEVPAGMVPLIKGSGPRTLGVVAGYSGNGTAAAAKLSAHGFRGAYVAQYANQRTGQVLSILASQFGAVAGATADFADDLRSPQGKAVATPTLGEQSSVTIQSIPGSVASQLVLVRFRRGTTTWSLAYKAGPTADPRVAIDLATKLLARTAT